MKLQLNISFAFFGFIVHVLGESLTLYAPFNSAGITGNISFVQERPEGQVTISVHLETLKSSSDGTYSWYLYYFPIPYDTKDPCQSSNLGRKFHDLSGRHSPINLPSEEPQTFHDSELDLQGPKTIWSRSLVLKRRSKPEIVACTNIFDSEEVRTAEATLTHPVTGKVIFRENVRGETIIYSNLYYTGDGYRPGSRHEWKLLVTDIFDVPREPKCNYLMLILDPNQSDGEGCGTGNHGKCKIGDLTKKHGQLSVGSRNNRFARKMYVDTNLPLATLGGSREIYLVLYDNDASRVFACGRIDLIEQKEVKAIMNMDGAKGYFRFSQRYRFDPTIVTIDLKNLNNRGKNFHVHQLPVPARITDKDPGLCSGDSVGGHFNPFDVKKNAEDPAMTFDEFEVGDLSGKYGPLSGSGHFSVHVDFNLPLFGPNSIVGRSIVIHAPSGERWVCATINHPSGVITAVAIFYYPVVGRVIFRQAEEKPMSETSVEVELSYSDGTMNSTSNHKWHIHANAPSRDFYNWSSRCSSAGSHFNPYYVGLKNYKRCSKDNPLRCEVGDLTAKFGKVQVAGFKGAINNRIFYTDPLLPLSGIDSIIGRSVVIHDDNAPTLRGNRMACTVIQRLHPLNVAVRSWKYGAGTMGADVEGSMTFHQSTDHDLTSGRVEMVGLNKEASGYHIHQVAVPHDKEFPCSDDVIYGHYNPLRFDNTFGPPPGAGTSDQYEVGDLSGKYGNLNDKTEEKFDLVDSNLPLHGMNSIVGRSVVIHKRLKGARWVCGNIQLEMDKSAGRELIALASFDDPRSKISGYIRFKQFEFKDGSVSQTWLEVQLKYPGAQNQNITHGHKWDVFVNQVGVDAFNKVDSVRCLAAGYRWNPYLSDSKSPLYRTDCSRRNPLRCEMGDVSGRQGLLSIGGRRIVLSDPNLPLAGNYSILGRSIVIWGREGSTSSKLACANILPDVHLVSTISVKRHPSFTVPGFMEHMREKLGQSEYLVAADVLNTRKILNGQCIQITVHFYGSNAVKHQIEFSNLINLGSVQKWDQLSGSQVIRTIYKPCRKLTDLDSGSDRRSPPTLQLILALILIIFGQISL